MPSPRSFRRPALSLAILLLAARGVAAQERPEVPIERIREAVQAAPAAHPRLMASDEDFAALRARVQSEPRAQALYALLHEQAEAMLRIEPVQHIVTGRRLLTESRKAVRRILTHAMVYRIGGEPRFLAGARREMLAAAAFPDWNPSHFLDTAEMSLAVAIGYDWLYDDLPAADRALLRQALLEKGIDAAETHGSCLTATNNWGQVCTAGIGAAALALLENDREMATRVIHRAVNGVPASMRASFHPDGTYPEGPGYWDYGTSFNVILIAELESALGSDFDLASAQGFDHTAEYINHATGPSGLFFNYADGGAARGPLPALYWFAHRFRRPDWLFFEEREMATYLNSEGAREVEGAGARLLPLALLWMREPRAASPDRMGLSWRGDGEIGVAMHRTSWTDPNAVYVGIKAGFAAGPHGQMDAGSFVLDADGERWAHDLGVENYNRIESLGMDLWNREQGSDRWKVFRNNNLSHNTLVIGGKPHDVNGHARLVPTGNPNAPKTLVDLSEVYRGQADSVFRGIAIAGPRVMLQDELYGVIGGAIRWGMVTRAEVEMRGPRTAVLTQNGKRLYLRVHAPGNATLRLYETATPPAEHDSPNPGTRMVGFEVEPAAAGPVRIHVTFTPGSQDDGEIVQPSLSGMVVVRVRDLFTD